MLLGFVYFKLFICPLDLKKPEVFRGFTPWTPTRAPPWTCYRAFNLRRPPRAFYNIQKFNLCSNTDISKIAWINAWPYWIFLLGWISIAFSGLCCYNSYFIWFIDTFEKYFCNKLLPSSIIFNVQRFCHCNETVNRFLRFLLSVWSIL